MKALIDLLHLIAVGLIVYLLIGLLDRPAYAAEAAVPDDAFLTGVWTILLIPVIGLLVGGLDWLAQLFVRRRWLPGWMLRIADERAYQERYKCLGWDAACSACGEWLHRHSESKCVRVDTWPGDGGDLWVYRCGHCGGENRLVPGLAPFVMTEVEANRLMYGEAGEIVPVSIRRA